MILDKVLRLFYKAVINIKSRWLLNRLVGSQEIIEVMLFGQIIRKTENYSVKMSKVSKPATGK